MALLFFASLPLFARSSRSTTAMPPPPRKNGVEWLDTCFGVAIGTFYLTLSLMDFSLWAFTVEHRRFSMFVEYLEWKGEQPVLGVVHLVLLLLLPFGLYNAIVNCLIGSLRRQAPLLRHVLDVLGAITLFVILYHAFFVIGSIESEALTYARLHSPYPERAQWSISTELQQALAFEYSLMLGLNVWQMLLTIAMRALFPANATSSGTGATASSSSTSFWKEE